MSRLSEVFPEGFTVEDDPLAIGGGHPAATADPLAVPMVSGFGQYATDRDGSNPDALRTISFYDVRDRVDNPEQVKKAYAQWLIPSTHQSRKGHDRNGMRPLIWADVDEPQGRTIRQTGEIVHRIVGGCDFEVYASRSATAEKQKCRILIPLAQAMPPHQWLTVSAVFRRKLAEAGIETDKASEVLGQVLYLPNAGKFYDATQARDGGLFQPFVGWADEVAEHEAELKRQAEAIKQAQEAARQRREALASSRTASRFRSPIEAFNAAYDVAEILFRNGYNQRGNTFRHPASESGNFSASVKDGRVHSLSTSDPLHTGGAGAHDAFSAFCVLEHGGDRDAAIRDAGDRWLTIGGESWNKVARREHMERQNLAERLTASAQQASAGFDEDGVLLDPPAPKLKIVSVFDVVDNPSPPPQYIWEGYLPQGVVSMLAAHGGTGKSTVALMLAVAAATGRPLFGVPTVQTSALFVSLEDGGAVVRHRLATICRAWGIDPRELEGVLHIVDGTEDPELYTADSARGSGDRTAAYREMRDMVEAHQVGLVIVDNASDAFGGDEIQRRQVRGFVRALAEVARSADSAVLLLAHVDKGTSRSSKPENGEGYSGSTAWHNSVRSRIFMSRNESGQISIKHQKTNFGRMRDEIVLIWPDDGLPQVEQAFSASYSADGLLQRAQGRVDDEKAAALLRLMAEHESRGEVFSPEPRAPNNVHAVMKADPAFKALKLGNEGCKAVLIQCERAGWIERTEYRKQYRDKTKWTITADGRNFANLPQVKDKASDEVAGDGET